jgi:DNA-binding XRE family transcriptional regulator
MHTTNQILDAISAKHGGVTDYRLAKFFGTSPQTVGHWRKGRSALSLDYALKAAELLGWEPAYVVACVERERAEKDARLEATDEIKATWEKIADAFKPAAAILAVMFVFAFAPNQVVRAADVTEVSRASSTLCVVWDTVAGARRSTPPPFGPRSAS